MNNTVQSVYTPEHRLIYILRLTVHATCCLMMWSSPAPHPFLKTQQRLMTLSCALVAAAFILYEYQPLLLPAHDVSTLFTVTVLYRLAEVVMATSVMSGCFLLHTLLRKQVYQLNALFYGALVTYLLSMLVHHNTNLRLSYIANSAISAFSWYILRQFHRAYADAFDNGSIMALIYLEIMLTGLNLYTFIASLHAAAWALKGAVYVLYMFRITLVYILVRPQLCATEAFNKEGSMQLLL